MVKGTTLTLDPAELGELYEPHPLILRALTLARTRLL
jgi:hypothetical protein